MHILPELRSRELAAQTQGARVSKRVTQTREESGAVEQGKGRICAQWEVLRLIVRVSREWIRCHERHHVSDCTCFGLPRSSRSVD